MEKIKLDFGTTLKEAISIGLKNAPSILGCVLLWIVTIWIPWINMGTTVAIMTLPVELSKGKVISPLSIFDKSYRQNFSQIFLTMGLITVGTVASMFVFFSGVILSYAWMLAIYFVLDKKMNPLDAILASYKATDGNKWTIFGVGFVLGLILLVAGVILWQLFDAINVGILTSLFIVCVVTVVYAMSIAVNASVYRQLKENA